MDEEEKRSIFQGLQAHLQKATQSSSDEVDSSSSSSIGSSIKSPPPSPPPTSPKPSPSTPRPSAPPPRSPSPASSDASTVEPQPYHIEPSQPLTNPPPSTSSPRPPSSPDSSAETVPPPSPAALERFRLAASPTAQQPAPIIVRVDNRGIDGWEADEKSRHSLEEAELASAYPRFTTGNFRFSADADAPTDHVPLSNASNPVARTAAWQDAGVLPKRIAKYLSPYQRDGVTFMYRLYERGRGGLLADAMGLGKTVQTVCFLGAAFAIWGRPERERNDDGHEGAPARILVVAPTSVRENWKKEFERWTPFRVEIYERAQEPTLSRRMRNGGVEVVITGDNPVWGFGKAFFEKPCGERKEWIWDVVIVDEIHVAKNDRTRIYKALKELPKFTMFGLTGTAVQNRLNELWNVMSLVVPRKLWPSKQSFKTQFVKVINDGSKKDASDYMRRRAQQSIKRLRKLLGKHMVRRPKSIIESHLPGKTDCCVLMKMKRDGLQGYMYGRFQNSYDVKLLRDAKLPCDCGSMEESKECCHRYPTKAENLRNAPIWRMHHKDRGPCERCPNCICLYLQHYSRCLAAHALLILPEDDESDVEKREFRQELFKYYLGDYAYKARGPMVTLEQEANVSCKLNVALRLLKSYEASGHKTIIFYESLRLGAILQRWATNKGLVFEVIDGSVHKGERQGAVDRFNTDAVCSIFFISKKAGGTGLNICGADRVLIFEPCWNPTLDLQAGDRAYRLGQKRDVQILRLVVENTIEHYVFKTAISKSQISNAILDNTKEEWRIRDDEVGSMHAMLRMGDVFTSRESAEDEFRVVNADELNGDGNVDQSASEKDERGSERLENGLVDDEVEEVEASGDEVNVFRDDVVCSLDVDVDDAMIPAPNEIEDELSGARNSRLPDSQMDTDEVLREVGAGGKMVITSTSARKRKRQLMGVNAPEKTSGINPAGAEGINFDDASWKDLPLSQEVDVPSPREEPSSPVTTKQAVGRPPLQKRAPSNGRIPVNPAVKQPKRGRKPRAVAQDTSKRRKTQSKGDITEPDKTKPRSAFAARARIRR